MTVIETSTSINKPVEQVFAFVTNPLNMKSLSPATTGVIFDGKIAVGSRYTVQSKYGAREFNSVSEIVVLDPNKKFAVKAIATPPATDVVSTYIFEKEGSGTRLHLSMDAAVMPGTEGMVVPQLRAGLDTSLAAFKKAIEG
jgi:ligand-binding SRPBCC domain-containing protein